MESVVYGLLDPDTLEIRYVGQTVNLERRHKEHGARSNLKANNHKNKWILSLLSRGLFPACIALERIPECDSDSAEQRWIKELKGMGARLTNATEGGNGDTRNLTKTTKIRTMPSWSEERRVNSEKAFTPELRRKIAETRIRNKKPNDTTGFIGVYSVSRGRKKWSAIATFEGKQYQLGEYDTPQEAALVYDAFIVRLYSDAQTNKRLLLVN